MGKNRGGETLKQLTQADYEKALAFATEKHKGQLRIGGDPYITHPIAVAEILRQQGCGVEYLIAALFHDLLEDTDATPQEIEAIAGAEVLQAVTLLTKHKGYSMEEYRNGIRGNRIAFSVKAADRLHNLRCAVVADDDFKRRYIRETIDWYWDFSDDIKEATRSLAHTLKEPLTEDLFL
jgi:(p)ppGpp synthase/HD superfamily hydrolase